MAGRRLRPARPRPLAGPRGGLPAGEALLRDVALMIDAVRSAPGPLVLLRHSMGGLIAARFVAGGWTRHAALAREVDGLVLSSPALDPA